ncbi:MAG: hypothetical protein NTZ24_05310, partial [Deltaproteobacteria bacterium]|nr:hypothetical protein [Deltaproteobacteria bacterium]
GRGVRPSLEYTALTAFRKIESRAVKGAVSALKITLPYEVADYLLNQKRSEISKLENVHDISIYISGNPDTSWDELKIESVAREQVEEMLAQLGDFPSETAKQDEKDVEPGVAASVPPEPAEQIKKIDKAIDAAPPPLKKKSRRKPRYRKKKPEEKTAETKPEMPPESTPEPRPETRPEATLPETKRDTSPVREEDNNPLNRLRKIFEQLVD